MQRTLSADRWDTEVSGPPCEVDGTAAACFDTHFDKSRILTASAAKTIARKLGRRGYGTVAEPQSFFVLDTEGPLKEGELGRARRWGAALGSSWYRARLAVVQDGRWVVQAAR